MKGKLHIVGLLTDGTTYKTELDFILWRSVFAVHFVPLKKSNLPEESAAARRILKGKLNHVNHCFVIVEVFERLPNFSVSVLANRIA